MSSQYNALDSCAAGTRPPHSMTSIAIARNNSANFCSHCYQPLHGHVQGGSDADPPTGGDTNAQGDEGTKPPELVDLENLATNLERASHDIDAWLKTWFQTNGAIITTIWHYEKWDTTLYQLLHDNQPADSNSVLTSSHRNAIKDKKKEILQLPVMRLVVLLGWRAFGLRIYCEQLFTHLLLLLTLTVSLGLSLGTATGPKFEKVLLFWLICTPFLLLSLLATRFLTWKNKGPCVWLTLAVWYGVVTGVLINYDTLLDLVKSQKLPKAGNVELFGCINNVLLGLSALYFCVFELRELHADATKRGQSKFTSILNLFKGNKPSPYLESYWNRVQLPTFVLVLVYVVCEFTAPFSANMRVYAGIPMLFLLFIMCVQYLEVFPAVGYLLPMMRRMLADVFFYLVFYFPIQCAYASAYYLLFKSQGGNLKPYEPEPAFSSNFTSVMGRFFPSANASSSATSLKLLEILKTKDKNDMFQGYESVPKSFLTTYLVSFGQINVEPFDQLASPSAYVLGYFLLVTHATIVVVMLLSVLIAMMNKTMDAHFAQDKAQACVTFAECVLRMGKVKTSTTRRDNLQQLGYKDLYDNIVHADQQGEKRKNDDAMLAAIAALGAKVDRLQARNTNQH